MTSLPSNLTSYGIDEADLSWSWVPASGGALPPGLTLDLTSGKVSGTPLGSGTFTFDVTVDAGSRSATKTFVLNVELPQIELRLNEGTIPATEAGSTFAGFDMSTLLTHVNIPKSDVTWDVDSLVTLDSAMNEKAGLPKGLALDAATGIISGGAEETGNFRFAVTASYVENNPTAEAATSRKEYTLAVTAAASYQYYRFNDSVTPAGSSNGVYWACSSCTMHREPTLRPRGRRACQTI